MTARLVPIDAEPLGATIVERLEEALEQAKAGDFSSVAIAVVYRDGTASCGWSDAPSYSCLIGSVARMQHKLIRLAEGDE